MEVTREIYWNVGHGVIWGMYPLAFLAMGICFWGFRRRLPVYRQDNCRSEIWPKSWQNGLCDHTKKPGISNFNGL
jgi:hypothetical protein